MLDPVIPKRNEPRQGLLILLSTSRLLAGDDVVEVANRESFDFHMPPPRVLELLDAIRRENQIQVKRSVFELNKIFAANDFVALLVRKRESQVHDGQRRGLAVVVRLLDVHI